MIEIRKLTLQRGLKTLLDQADIVIHPGRRIGLIGKNGSGKSSLFALIQGQLLPDSGEVILPPQWRLSAVAQETPSLDTPALDYVLSGDDTLTRIQNQLAAAEAVGDGITIADCHTRLQEADAYTARARAAKLLDGLGFSEAEHQQSVKHFSGGWRMRLNLAQALMAPADLLLLDEPTNHLDLETVLWLEHHLVQHPATQLIISHDRDFLNAVCTHTIELSGQKLHAYGGNYDFYQQERARRLNQQQAAYRKQQEQIRNLQSFIARFKAKASKATQAQSRIKALEKLERLTPAHIDNPFTFTFDSPEHLPSPLLKLDQASLGYDGHPILQNLDLSLESGSRYGLLGVNGSGKSTFIKSLSGSLSPQQGRIIRSDKLHTGYFAQHQLDSLNPDQSPLWHIRRHSPQAREQDIRNFLGGFGFSGDTALQSTGSFSGGEKARLALAILVWQKPNLLLLDEPTNHLDLDMRHALTLALQNFTGSLILVSHDRNLLESTCDRFLLIENGRLDIFDGDLEDYRRHRLNRDTSTPSVSTTAQSRKENKRTEAKIRQERAKRGQPLLNKIRQIEEHITRLETQQHASETFLTDTDSYTEENKNKLQQEIARMAEIKVQLNLLEEEWLSAQEQLENIYAAIEVEYGSNT